MRKGLALFDFLLIRRLFFLHVTNLEISPELGISFTGYMVSKRSRGGRIVVADGQFHSC